MGLDQYAYVANKAGARAEYYVERYERGNKDAEEPREIAYWRKHPNLQGWMEQLWIEKQNAAGTPVVEDPEWGSSFNGVELELTYNDIIRFEEDLKAGKLVTLNTTGFFFGNPSDDYYAEQDLDFCKKAKAELFCGLKLFYNSSW
jgi:hypothetical protein